jgi:hypothetical protein
MDVNLIVSSCYLSRYLVSHSRSCSAFRSSMQSRLFFLVRATGSRANWLNYIFPVPWGLQHYLIHNIPQVGPPRSNGRSAVWKTLETISSPGVGSINKNAIPRQTAHTTIKHNSVRAPLIILIYFEKTPAVYSHKRSGH